MLCLNILIWISLDVGDTGSMIYALNKPLNNKTRYTWRTSCLCFYFMVVLLWDCWLELRLAFRAHCRVSKVLPRLFLTSLYYHNCYMQILSSAAWCSSTARILVSASPVNNLPDTGPSHIRDQDLTVFGESPVMLLIFHFLQWKNPIYQLMYWNECRV